jgi:hypothetical protein
MGAQSREVKVFRSEMVVSSLRGALATKQSSPSARAGLWIASLRSQ